MQTKRLFTFILFALVLNLAAMVQAATYTVDDDGSADFSSIQAAIDPAGSGDTILVESGTYIETLELITNNVISRTTGAGKLHGKNHDAGYVERYHCVISKDSSPPVWQWIQNETLHSWTAMKAGHLESWQDPGCAYQFHLRVWARTTDGFTHIRSATFNDHYYIQIGSANSCQADVNHDGSVDGENLGIFADE